MPTHGFNLAPTNFEEAWRLATVLSQTTFCSPAMRGKPGDVLACLSMGAELGLSPMQALCSIAVINGKPGLYGDGLMGVVRRDASIIEITESFETGWDGKEPKDLDDPLWDSYVASCTLRRERNGKVEETTRTFSVIQAKRAGLWKKRGKEGGDTPWITYPDRMVRMRARGYTIRDGAADLTRGIGMIEELQDIEPIRNVTPTNYEPAADETPEQTEEIFVLASALGLKRAQVMLEIRRDGHEAVLSRLRAESGPTNGVAAEPPAVPTPAVEAAVDAQTDTAETGKAGEPDASPASPPDPTVEKAKKRLFGIFKKLDIGQIPKGLRGKAREDAEQIAKSQRLVFAADCDVFVESYTELTPEQWTTLADAAEAKVNAVDPNAPLAAVECDGCGVDAGMAHFAGCPFNE
jgi:hypothetical protein